MLEANPSPSLGGRQENPAGGRTGRQKNEDRSGTIPRTTANSRRTNTE